jgi:hypothetical protein
MTILPIGDASDAIRRVAASVKASGIARRAKGIPGTFLHDAFQAPRSGPQKQKIGIRSKSTTAQASVKARPPIDARRDDALSRRGVTTAAGKQWHMI